MIMSPCTSCTEIRTGHEEKKETPQVLELRTCADDDNIPTIIIIIVYYI